MNPVTAPCLGPEGKLQNLPEHRPLSHDIGAQQDPVRGGYSENGNTNNVLESSGNQLLYVACSVAEFAAKWIWD